MAHILYRNGANRSGGSHDETQHPQSHEGADAYSEAGQSYQGQSFDDPSDRQPRARPQDGAFDMGYVGHQRGGLGYGAQSADADDDFGGQTARRGGQGRMQYAPTQHPAVHQSLMEAVRDENPAVRHFIDLQRAAEARAAKIAAEIAAAEAARRAAEEQQARFDADARLTAAAAHPYGADYGRDTYDDGSPYPAHEAYGDEYNAPHALDPRLLTGVSAAQRSAQKRQPARLPEAPQGVRAALGAYIPAGGMRWMMQRTAALASVAMFIGLGVWGYQLAQREKDGLQVIAAPAGPSREAPLDPGGELARHTGLSVNSVAAIGSAAPGPDRVTLAPRPLELAEEDAPMAQLKPLPVRSAPQQGEGDQPMVGGERLFDASLPVADLRGGAKLATGLVPPAPLELGEDLTPPDAEDPVANGATAEDKTVGDNPVDSVAEAIAASVEGTAVDPQIADAQPTFPTSVPGLKVSPRPIPRPGGDLVAETAALNVASALNPATPEAIEIAPDSLASGTRLVQIGAHDSADQARAEWDRVTERFGALMEGKRRVIQEAVSGGRTFYRLRVEGFTDVADSRRFCAALVAERTNCIPAQVR